MKYLLKKIALLLIAALCIGAVPVLAGEEEQVDFNYYNSIVAEVVTDTRRDFVPADFPETDCSDVIITKSTTMENGFNYEMIIVLKKSGDYEVGKAVGAVGGNPLVKYAHRNEYAEHESYMTFNHSSLYLKVGETADINIKDIHLSEKPFNAYGVEFKIDPVVFDADNFEKDTFSEYGIISFWPDSAKYGNSIIDLKPAELEATKSENGIYYGIADSSFGSYIDVVDKMADKTEFLSVSVTRSRPPGGKPMEEIWECGNSDVASVVLSGGVKESSYTLINQTATITALKSGVTVITANRNGFDFYPAIGKCVVIVYLPGDIDGDEAVTAEDALCALSHAVGKNLLSKDSQRFADMNEDGRVTAIDALMILQYALRKV